MGVLATIRQIKGMTKMESIEIQVQDSSGMWRTYQITMNIPQLIIARMEELKRQFPDRRIRAIDQHGRVVDIL